MFGANPTCFPPCSSSRVQLGGDGRGGRAAQQHSGPTTHRRPQRDPGAPADGLCPRVPLPASSGLQRGELSPHLQVTFWADNVPAVGRKSKMDARIVVSRIDSQSRLMIAQCVIICAWTHKATFEVVDFTQQWQSDFLMMQKTDQAVN